ncbi:MAG: His/Gly/Thr/Pro-type tRNA ligase C-terminal domain-containing protein [Candidatus Diapherotrites archaeon]|nr:His/Gly/Thr/Pro-type tRNA ligase C-terminal domain-containing protein [Candidatus Diapherotrites archaeon]
MKDKEKKEILPERLPSRKNFIDWYNKVIELAEVIDRRYGVKGTFVWMPYGLKIMKKLVRTWDRLFEEAGIEETYFPLFVPLKYAEQNDSWFEGFKKNLYAAVPFLGDNAQEKLIIRPTGEPAMYPMFKLWIRDGKLPIKIYETVSSFRLEGKKTHAMIRDREITYWYEIHTAHKTREEAYEEMQKHIKINENIWKLLCCYTIKIEKPKYELFPGAESAIEFYVLLPDGRLLENGSVNNLGQAYAKKFGLVFEDANGKKQYCWQICTGNGARYLVSTIALHGDERGLVLPPALAPIQVIIIPIFKKNSTEIEKIANEVADELKRNGVVANVDARKDKSAGEKFYVWDIKGVPLRIEIGEKELNCGKFTVFRRDTKERILVEKAQLCKFVKKLLDEEIPKELYEKTKRLAEEKIKYFENIVDALKWIKKGGAAKVPWCENIQCYEKIVSMDEGLDAAGSILHEHKNSSCCICTKPTEKILLVGKGY